MAKFRSVSNSFIAGEISPTAFGRTDLPFYRHACKTLRNMIPNLSGGAYRRPGTFREDSFSESTEFAPALVPFVVSKTEAYCLAIGQTLAGVEHLSAYVPGSNSAESSNATISGSLPYQGSTNNSKTSWGYYDDWHEAQYVQSADTMWMVHRRYQPYKITRTSASHLSVGAFNANSSTTVFRDSWPYFAQAATALTVGDTLTISNAAVGTGRTLTYKNAAGTATAFFQGVDANGDFSHGTSTPAGHTGAVFKVDDGAGTIGVCQVTDVAIDGKSATVAVIVAFGDTAAHSTWWESAWSDYRGWPRAVGFYGQRLVYAGTRFSPDTLWFSKLNNYSVLSVSTDTDPTSPALTQSPFTAILSSEQLNAIQWISADKTLVAGTQGDEWMVEPINPSLGVYAGNLKATRQSAFGSAPIQAVRKSDELIFCRSSQDELRGLVFNYIQQSYTGEPIQQFYDEFPLADPSGTYLGDRKIRRMVWDGSRNTLWCCDTAGNLRGVTRDRQSQVIAWHSHQLGGYDATETGTLPGIDLGGGVSTVDPAYCVCSGSVISLAVVPNPLIGTDDVWMVVKRKISGVFQYQVERMIGKGYPLASAYGAPDPSGAYFVDAAVYLLTAPTAVTTFSNLSHLEGKVPVGTAFNSKGIYKVSGSAVSAGVTALTSPSGFHRDTLTTVVVMGLVFSSIIEPVRIEAGSQIGSAQAAYKRIHLLTPRFYRSISCKLGRDADTLETLIFREGSTPMGKSAELYTGDKVIEFNGDYDTDGLVYIIQDQPLPFSIVSIVAEGMEYD